MNTPVATYAVRADRASIESALLRCSRNFDENRWLTKNHPCKLPNGVIEQLERLAALPQGSVIPNGAKLAEYTAISVFLNLRKAWGYLGNAISAGLRGSFENAIHLSYYAELNSVFSVLAAEGIFIGKGKHFVVNNTGECVLIKGINTHKDAWAFFKNWSNSGNAEELIGENIFFEGVSLQDWLNTLSGSSGVSGRTQVLKWLNAWGVDIERLANDQELRNVSSYRGNPVIKEQDQIEEEIYRFSIAVKNLWTFCQPDNFSIFDRSLVREGLISAYGEINYKRSGGKFNLKVEQAANSLAVLPSPGLVDEFCTRPESWNLFKSVTNTTKSNSSPISTQVLTRAFLLLRLATLAAYRLQKRCNFSSDKLNFYRRDVSNHHSLNIDDYALLSDLWVDIEDIINGWTPTRPHPREGNTSLAPADLITLSQTERVYLWAI